MVENDEEASSVDGDRDEVDRILDESSHDEEEFQPYQEFRYASHHDTDEFKRSAAKTFLLLEKKPFVYFTMAIGYEEFDNILDTAPFKNTNKKELTDAFKPNKKSLQTEVKRRAHFLLMEHSNHGPGHPLYSNGRVQAPRPSQWRIGKLMDWLKNHTLVLDEEKDLAFLKNRIESYSQHLTTVLNQQSTRAQQDITRWAQQGWEGILPWIRLISILMKDEYREDYVNRCR